MCDWRRLFIERRRFLVFLAEENLVPIEIPNAGMREITPGKEGNYRLNLGSRSIWVTLGRRVGGVTDILHQMPARRPTQQGDSPGVDTVSTGVVFEPLHSRPAIFDRGRVRCFFRETVIDRCGRIASTRKLDSETVVVLARARQPAASVNQNH